jgi:hypothetical protein
VGRRREGHVGDGGGDRAWGVRAVVGVSLLPNTTKSAPWWNSILQNNTIDTNHV